jgi:hypothetical protein
VVYLSCIDDCLEEGPDSVDGSAGGQPRTTAAPPVLPVCLHHTMVLNTLQIPDCLGFKNARNLCTSYLEERKREVRNVSSSCSPEALAHRQRRAV